MSDLLFIIGPLAAGKAAVGSEIARLTPYRLFHNHHTAEPAAAVFGWGTREQEELVTEYRMLTFRRVLETANPPNLIFTFVWGFDLESDNIFVRNVINEYTRVGRCVQFLELEASLKARISREGTPLRMSLKPSKQNVEASRALHTQEHRQFQMNSNGNFPYPDQHLVVNTELSTPEQAARLAIEHFGLPYAS